MPKIPKEDETCALCAYCKLSPERKLIEYPDGQHRMISGVCDNSESPLFKKPLVVNFDAQMNASFHNLRIPRGVRCFSRKVVPAIR